MAIPTYTRRELRKLICGRMNMRFFDWFDEYSTVDTGSSASKLIDASLTQPTDYWNGSWIYMIDGPAAGDSRLINDFNEEDNTIYPGLDFSGTPGAGNFYQIIDIFSPIKIHKNINIAIEEGSQYFFGLSTEQPIVVEEDKLEYTLSGFTNSPWRIYKAWVENPNGVIRGTATSGTTSVLTDTGANFSDVEAGWMISIYAGTGKGQLRTVGSATSTTITPSAVFATAPDETSKYAVWDPNDQKYQWTELTALRFDSLEYPSTLYLLGGLSAFHGMRLRFQYSYKPAALTSDTDATPVPKDFIIPFTIALLYESKQDDNRVDRGRYQANAEQLKNQAITYGYNHAFQQPSMTLWQLNAHEEETYGLQSGGDPLGWNSR